MSAAFPGLSRSCVKLCVGAALCMCACARASGPGASGETSPAEPERLSELELICAHSYALVIEPTGAGSPAVREEFMTRCASNSEQRRSALSEQAWRARSSCVLAATNSDELGVCDGRQPKPEAPKALASEAQASAAQVCGHIFDLLQAEIGAPLPSEDLSRFREDCEREIAKMIADEPATFERTAPCVLAARSMEDMAACEED